jgi:hypothetical protein
MTNPSGPADGEEQAHEDGQATDQEGDSGESYASVVHVDRHEDIASICGRIDTAPSYAVVIHAPGGNRALSRELGMRRVLRHAEETGKAIAFATSSPALSSRARSLGIPVARKPEYVRWDAGGRVVLGLGGKSVAIPAFGRLLQVLVILGIAAGFVAFVGAMGPAATVTAYPPSETLEQVVRLAANEGFDELDLDNMRVPAVEVVSSRVVTVVIPTTGSTMVGTAPATVTVTVTNPTGDEVTVPSGAVVVAELDNGTVEFGLEEEVTLAPDASAPVTATALTPGSQGNVPAGSIGGFSDSRFEDLAATNEEAAEGGEDESRPAVDQEDIVTLRDTAALLETAQAIKQTIVDDRPRDAIFIDTAAVEVERGDPSDVPGTPADIVSMDVRVTVSALAIPESVLNEVARELLAPEDGSGEFITGTVSAAETGSRQVDAVTGTITAEFRLRGEFARGVTSAEIEDAVKGVSPGDVPSILQSRYGIDNAEVELTPGWAPRLPRFGFRIDVEMSAPPSADAAPEVTTTIATGE